MTLNFYKDKNGISQIYKYIKKLKENKFVLLSIFRKQTKKTPRREIEKAKIEGFARTPQYTTLMRLLRPMGYTLKVVPLNKK